MQKTSCIASKSNWCITPKINDHAFHGRTKHQLKSLWKFEISPYWERIFVGSCGLHVVHRAFQTEWKSAGKWKTIKNHVEAVQRFLNSKRTVNWIEHFRWFSIDVLADTLGWGWTHWVEDEHPSNGSLGKCCECLKASSNLTQIRTT